MLAVALLFAVLMSVAPVSVTFTVCEICVPPAVPAGTVTTTENGADEPAVNSEAVQLKLPEPPTGGAVVHTHPAGTEPLTNAVPAGVAPVTVTVVAVAGPAFVIVKLKVTLLPAYTGYGVAVSVTLKLFCVELATVVLAEARLLLGNASVVFEPTSAEFVITVPDAVAAGTVTVSVKVVVPAFASDAFVHEIVPAAPTAGVVQVHAVPVCAIDLKVVVPGVASVNVFVAAAAGPLFFTTIV